MVWAAAHLQPGMRVLDVGAGEGRHSLLMARRGLRMTAVDVCPELLERLREHPGGQGIDTEACDMAQLASAVSGPFDAAVGFFVLHHLDDLGAAFGSLREVLRPGARIAFCEPSAYYLPFYVQIALSRTMTWRGERGMLNMRPKVVLGAMQASGFRDAAFQRFGLFPPALANPHWGRGLEAACETRLKWLPLRAFYVFHATVCRT
jgi:cyclopropane fatty-acyl-phospholipid synthase-like methyltransferase